MPIINPIYTSGSNLPPLTNPALESDVLQGKEYIDGNGEKQIGNYVNYEDQIVSGAFQGAYENNRINKVGAYKFYGDKGITSISSNSISEVQAAAFRGSSLKAVLLPNCSVLRTQAFYLCTKLISVTLSNGIHTMDSGAFYGCSSLTSFPVSEYSAISDFTSQAFFGCTGLTAVVMPREIRSVHMHTFQGCNNILLYDFRNRELNTIPTTGGSWQGMNADCKIVVPDALYDAWIIASNWVSMASHIVKASDYID